MGGLKIVEPKIEIPKIPEGMKAFHPIEMPVFTVAPDGKVAGVFKPAEAPTLQIVPDLKLNTGVRYSGLGPISLPPAVQIGAKDQAAVVGFFKSVLDLIGKGLVRAFEHPPWFGGPFMFMILARFLLPDPKNQGAGDEVIVRLNSYDEYRGRRDALEARTEEPLTISFQGSVETRALNSFYVDEIVTRGERPLQEGARVRVTTTAFAENPVSSRLENPTGPEEVKGYRLVAGEAGEEVEVLLYTQDRSVVEQIHQQVAAEYERTGSAQEAIDWLTHQSPYRSSLFEPPPPISPTLNPPPALTNILSAERPDLAVKVKQVKLEDFPPQVSELVKSLVEINKIDEYEHAGIAIRLGNGAVFRRGAFFGGDITSWEPKQIKDGDAFQMARGSVLYQAKIEAGRNPELFRRPITIYFYHTHPYRKPSGFTETPVYQHDDGRVYTLTNEVDADLAQALFDQMAGLLRRNGFSGPIEMQAGAIPTRKGKGDQRYVATFFLY